MTQEEKMMLMELYQWMQQRKQQQLAHPLDEASKETIGIYPFRTGATALTQTYTDSAGNTVTAPKAYTGSVVLIIQGKGREVPYIA